MNEINPMVAAILTIVGVCVIIAPLLIASNPQWFERRQALSNAEPDGAEPLAAEGGVEIWLGPGLNNLWGVRQSHTGAAYAPITYAEDDQLVQLVEPAVESADLDDQTAQRIQDEIRDYLDNRPGPTPTRTPDIRANGMPEPMPDVTSKRRRDYTFTVGQDGSGQFVTFPLGHMLLVRSTGGGKSNLVGILIGQAIKQGMLVHYINVAYAPIDEDLLDISPLVDRCTALAIEPHGLDQLNQLRQVVALINDRAIKARTERIAHFLPVLVVVEELKALQDRLRLLKVTGTEGMDKANEEVGSLLSILLSSGRRYNVNVLIVSQDAQVQTTGMSEGTQVNFEVKIGHPSLDRASLQKLLPKWMLGRHARRHELPNVTSPHQWYVITPDEQGVEQIAIAEVPKLRNDDIVRYVYGIPTVDRSKPVEAQKSAYLWQGDEMPAEVQSPALSPPVQPQELFQAVIPRQVWTDQHIKAAGWIMAQKAMDSELSNRKLATYLYGKSDGRHNVRAGEILLAVCKVLGIEPKPPEQWNGMEQTDEDGDE